MASFSAYDRVNAAQFNPLSAQELMMPAQMMAEQHTQLEEQYMEQQDKAASLRSMLIDGVDKDSISKYDKFNNILSDAVNTLSSKGVADGTTRSSLLAARRKYSSELLPVQAAATARVQAAQQLKQLKMQDNTLEYINPYSISVEQGVKDPSVYMSGAISGLKVRQQVAEQAQALAKTATVPPSIMAIPGFKFKYISKLGTGATMEQVMQAAKADGDTKTQDAIVQAMSGIVENTLKANGVYDMFGRDSQQADRIRGIAVGGLSHAIGEPKYNFVDDQYGMQSALMNQKAALDRKELEYKASLAAKKESQGQIFDYGFSKPTVNGSKKEMPKNFDDMFSRDGRGTLLASRKSTGGTYIKQPIDIGSRGANAGLSVLNAARHGEYSNNNASEMSTIIKTMRTKYGNQRDSRGIPIKLLTDKQVAQLYYTQNNVGGFASSTLTLRDDSHTFGNNETLNNPYDTMRNGGAVYVDGKELKNVGDKEESVNNYAKSVGLTDGKTMKAAMGSSKYQWNIGTSKSGRPVFETYINGHVVQKDMNESQRTAFEPFSKIAHYDENSDFINSKPLEFKTDNGISFHVSKDINGLNIKYRSGNSKWETASPKEIVQMAENRGASRGFITKVNYGSEKE